MRSGGWSSRCYRNRNGRDDRLDGRCARSRERNGRAASPSACIIDSQSVKTSEAGGPSGYDAGKKIMGRKQHALVDTDGRGLVLSAHPASGQDRDGAGPFMPVLLEHRSERGVGKTSLANVFHLLMNVPTRHIHAIRVQCDPTDNFNSVWQRAFEELTVTEGEAGQRVPLGGH